MLERNKVNRDEDIIRILVAHAARRGLMLALVGTLVMTLPAHAQTEVPPATEIDGSAIETATTSADVLPLATESTDAATINVNTTTDELNTDGDCSLREAIESSNQDKAVSGCVAGSGTTRSKSQPGRMC